MNTLFIIGNGFDLNLDLKTSYKDFYEYYKKTPSTNEEIRKLKLDIEKDIINWSDLELALGNYTEEIEKAEEFEMIFEDLLDHLSKYLRFAEVKISERKNEENKEKLIESICYPEKFLLPGDRNPIANFIRGKYRHSNGNIIDVITFNYTRTLETLLNFNGEEQLLDLSNNIHLNSIEHIHGYIDEL